MKRRERLLFVGAAPLAVTIGLLACSSSDSPREAFNDPPDAAGDSPARLPDAAAPEEDADADAGSVDASTPFDGSDEPVVCTAKPCVTQLVAASSHFCALLDDKTVQCWGSAYRAFGVLDGGNPSGATQPRPKSMGLSNVEQISAANSTTCARLTDGTVTCWGSNQDNVLGLYPPVSDYVAHNPGLVATDGGAVTGFRRVDVGAFGVTFAVKESGELWSWGDNAEFALARVSEGSSYLGPGPAADLLGEKVTRAGGLSSRSQYGIGFAITEKGKLWTWGTSKQVNAYPGPVPVAVAGLENVSNASVIANNICAVADGHLYCWGLEGSKACTGTTASNLAPIEIRTRGTARAQQVSVNYSNTCVRLTDGTVECCGSSALGQLGTGSLDADAGVGARAPLLTEAKAFTGQAVQVAVSLTTVCALVQGGTVQCWGGNPDGQLGQGTQDKDPHPIPATVTFE